MNKESKYRLKVDAFLPIFFFLPFLVVYIPIGLQGLSGSVLTHPFHLVYDYKALKISNIIQVFIMLIPMIYFVCFGKVLILKKVLIPFYTLIIFSIFSSFDSNDFFLSFKRLAITFIPMFCIIQYFSNHKEPSKIFNFFCNYFIIFVLFLCLYALTVHTFDSVGTMGFPGRDRSTIMDSIKIDLGESFYKFVEYFNPNHSYENTSQKCGNIGFLKIFDIYFGQFYSCRNFYEIWLSRPSSLLSNTIGFSQLLLVSLIIVFNKFLRNKNIYFLLFFFIFFIFFLWTFSRISQISLIISLIFLIIPFKNISKIISISLIFITSSFLLIIFLSTSLLDTNYLEPRHAINLERLSLFLNIANYWDSYGFTGVGFGLSYEGFLSAIKTNLNYQKHLDIVSIPSIFITILVELGLIGFIILNLTIFFPIYYCNNRNKILIVLIFCIFLTQLTDISVFRFHPFNFLFAFLIGLISNNNYQNEKIEK